MTYSGLDSGVRLDMSSDVGTEKDKPLLELKCVCSIQGLELQIKGNTMEIESAAILDVRYIMC